MAGAGEEDEAGGVGVEAVDGPGHARRVGGGEERDEGVAVETPARVDRERRGLVDDDDGFVLVEEADVGVHGRLDLGRENLEEAASGPEQLAGRQSVAVLVEEATGGDAVFPLGPFDVGEKGGDEFQQRKAIVRGGDEDGAVVDGGDGAGERVAS